jgi:hypothetical protein
MAQGKLGTHCLVIFAESNVSSSIALLPMFDVAAGDSWKEQKYHIKYALDSANCDAEKAR